MTVGELAERTGVPTKTLRYYEEIGLLVPQRTPAGWRAYDETALVVLQLTAVGKRLGLSLADIVRFVGLFRNEGITNDQLLLALEPHQRRLQDEIASLQNAQALLSSLVTHCPLRRC